MAAQSKKKKNQKGYAEETGDSPVKKKQKRISLPGIVIREPISGQVKGPRTIQQDKNKGKGKIILDPDSAKVKKSCTLQQYKNKNPDQMIEGECSKAAERKKNKGKRMLSEEDKNEESESSDDDDFEVVHPRVQIANLMDVRCKRRGVKENFPKKKKVRQIMASVPGLRTRTSPASLFKKISLMNEAKKQAVRDMGFGSVLQLGVRKLPGKLAFWVVEHFDCKSCSIVVGGNQGIRVDEDDVYRVYGFPKGKKEIEIFERKHRSPLYDEWLAFFEDSTKDDIKITHVLDVMIERVDADIWFKRHFIIAMACCLIESMTNGTVHPYILNCLHDMDKLREWNWGAYVLDSACDQRLSWDKNKKKVFAGPALFLTVHIVVVYFFLILFCWFVI
ncbi:uncharacterized protein LOC131020534 [Salvia miltiorrhiza]|uniref:uncharacterized protein LOC131020534 n=1 Tax=Salvia miltiorrhiza TaxID=226208 RepID=UPI0025ACF324|nr:uncharacterized protein LOC131020534 [Salvia miltiorrhiza]